MWTAFSLCGSDAVVFIRKAHSGESYTVSVWEMEPQLFPRSPAVCSPLPRSTAVTWSGWPTWTCRSSSISTWWEVIAALMPVSTERSTSLPAIRSRWSHEDGRYYLCWEWCHTSPVLTLQFILLYENARVCSEHTVILSAEVNVNNTQKKCIYIYTVYVIYCIYIMYYI